MKNTDLEKALKRLSPRDWKELRIYAHRRLNRLGLLNKTGAPDAEDMLNEVVARILEGRLKDTIDDLLAWNTEGAIVPASMKKALKRAIYSRSGEPYRKNKRRERFFDDHTEADEPAEFVTPGCNRTLPPEDALEISATFQKIASLVTDEQFDLLDRRFIRNETYQQIAQARGTSISTIRSQLKKLIGHILTSLD